MLLKWKDVKEECMYVDSIRVLYIWFVNVSVIDIVMRESIRQLREINDFGICRCVLCTVTKTSGQTFLSIGNMSSHPQASEPYLRMFIEEAYHYRLHFYQMDGKGILDM